MRSTITLKTLVITCLQIGKICAGRVATINITIRFNL